MTAKPLTARPATATAVPMLIAVSSAHLINDLLQSLLPASYPILQKSFDLTFTQVGLMTLAYQITASILQPFVGHFTDRRPMPYSLAIGMFASLIGLLTIAYAQSYAALLVGGMILGVGSSIFHPEASRIARLASGGSHGFAQSLFQVGGNFGAAAGPLAAAFIILPQGQRGLAWFALAALCGMVVLAKVGSWYAENHLRKTPARQALHVDQDFPDVNVPKALGVLLALMFSKYTYLAAFTSYYAFYLIDRFGLETRQAQIIQFLFLAAVAAGTIAGGPVGDKVGRKPVIWISILGVLPFSLMLPHVGLTATTVLSMFIGFIMSSAFPAIVVYGQELVPGRVGMVSGLFFGFVFGVGGIAAAALGALADHNGIYFVFLVCSFLPAIGILAAFLPKPRR